MHAFKNLNRIEFMVTHTCSGQCKHCSVSDRLKTTIEDVASIDQLTSALRDVTKHAEIESVMTFGGEPLLRHETVCAVHQTAKELGIKDRHLITNGFFTKDRSTIKKVAQNLATCGITSICVSVDAFHQETIPIELVEYFIQSLLEADFNNIHLHPAWVVNKEHDNPYNKETKRLLRQLAPLQVNESNGNTITLKGNAKKYLSDYYTPSVTDLSVKCGEMKYANSLDDVRFLSIQPNGDIELCKAFKIGNVQTETVKEMLLTYNPMSNENIRLITEHGVQGLVEHAKRMNLTPNFDPSDSMCSICTSLQKTLSC
ncbi:MULTISPECIES: radical SAM protein [unclassified Fusibacter]|uniref:radical SAM protein n=1 Tax=unclassified Fusibacter TaxID=2624464 RepID=UPI0010135082|nr:MULTISPECIES: radical SAM protein [unclassified Fusibacter]MCK8058949.1 radical SAM protein [Fusibacter sp. A2]NPE22025.1 radical SAM protein [Fusibacter sp. A1]RXV61590.1 radical SAM protein [Fusibacter sp. A1]